MTDSTRLLREALRGKGRDYPGLDPEDLMPDWVPVLTDEDITQHEFGRWYAREPHCLSAWLSIVFFCGRRMAVLRDAGLSGVLQGNRDRVAERILKAFGKEDPDEIMSLNDDRPREEIAKAWNDAWKAEGYDMDNPEDL